eukprot:GEMP01073577.1.p1 GENE.GEMP01073577.1~~GEMP01073577.1.p1  ORF type:complete len:114 (-),score=2.57 GEMP01073577.1:103-444(-)
MENPCTRGQVLKVIHATLRDGIEDFQRRMWLVGFLFYVTPALCHEKHANRRAKYRELVCCPLISASVFLSAPQWIRDILPPLPSVLTKKLGPRKRLGDFIWRNKKLDAIGQEK